jgi:hypothetical protein
MLAGSPARYRIGVTPEFLLLKNSKLVGPVRRLEDDRVLIAPAGEQPAASDVFHIAEGIVRKPERPFTFARGRMWIWSAPELSHLADNVSDPPNNSPVFLFQDGAQLPWPRALHADIEHRGSGRFSHWGREVLFAPTDNVDPNTKLATFRLVIATEGLADDQQRRLRSDAEGDHG